jgi:uncharacterized damage-inducible protein DinB
MKPKAKVDFLTHAAQHQQSHNGEAAVMKRQLK